MSDLSILINITNTSWNGSIVSFTANYQYTGNDDGSYDGGNKTLTWSVGGITKGSLNGGVESGTGNTQFSYSSASTAVTVHFVLSSLGSGTLKAYDVIIQKPVIINKSFDVQFWDATRQSFVLSNADFITLDSRAPSLDYALTNIADSTLTPQTLAFVDNAINTKLATKNSTPTPNTTMLTSVINQDVKLVDNIITGTIKITRNSTFPYQLEAEPLVMYVNVISGTVIISHTSYPFVLGQSVEITKTINIPNITASSVSFRILLWDTEDRAYAPVSAKTLTNTSSTITTVPITPVLSVTPIDKYNFILSWTGDVTDQFNLERATSTLGYSSLFGDLQDTDNQVNTNIPAITETYYYRIRTKNSVGYSNYSNVITVVNTEPVTPPPPPTVTVPNPPVLQMLVSSDPLAKLLKWNMDSNVTSYNIESSNPLTDPLWMSLTGDLTVGTDLGTNNDLGDQHWGIRVTMGTSDGLWKYRIRGKNSVGYSNYSNIVSYTISNNIPEPPPPISDSKNLLSMFTKLFAMGTGLGLLVSKK